MGQSDRLIQVNEVAAAGDVECKEVAKKCVAQPRLTLDEKHGKICRVRLEVATEWLHSDENDGENQVRVSSWFAEHSKGMKERMSGYTCRTLALIFFLSAFAFMHPVFLPCVVASQSVSIIIRAFAEIGLIVSFFLAFKFALAAVLPLVFCTSIIVSYSTLRALPGLTFEAQVISMAALCIVLNILTAISLCCHMKRRTRSQLSGSGMKNGDSIFFEFPIARSFGEYLT